MPRTARTGALVLALLLLATGQAAAAPADLVVRAIQVPSPPPEAGQVVTFTATLWNQGYGDAGYPEEPRNFTVAFYVDDVSIGSTVVPYLQARQEADVTSPPWTSYAGNHTVRAVADATDLVAEDVHEDNNDATATFQVVPGLPRPDLAVVDAHASRPSPRAGDALTLTARVRNQGTAAAGAFAVEFLLDDASLGRSALPGLDAATTASVTLGWTALEGNHTLRVVADADRQVAESAEGNNALAKALTVRPAGAPLQPDLAVLDVTRQPRQPGAGDAVVFAARVENRGEGPAGAFLVAFRLDGQPIGGATAPGLAPGAALEVQAPRWNATLGAHTVQAEADPARTLGESDVGNNAQARAFVVLPQGAAPSERPDLLPDRLTSDPPHPRPGDRVVLTARVVKALAVANASFEVAFSVDDVTLGKRHVELNETVSVKEVLAPPWTALDGVHVAAAVVDADGQVAEADETNNRIELRLDVSAEQPLRLADLASPSAAVQPPNPAAGMQVVFRLRIANGGGAAGPFVVDFAVDGASVGTSRLDGLEAGAGTEVTSPPWAATEGTHTLRALLDADHEVDEGDEGNNRVSLAFTVEPARGAPSVEPLLGLAGLALAARARRR